MRECLRVIAHIQAKGMNLVTRIELAAAFLASACELAFESAEQDGRGPQLFALTEDLVLRRARELYST